MTTELSPEQLAANAAQEAAMLSPANPVPEGGRELTAAEAAKEAGETEFAKMLDQYETDCRHAVGLTTKMSSRQLGRVFRALLKAPFESNPHFENLEEKRLFSVSMRAMDTKTTILLISLKESEKQARLEAQKAAEAGLTPAPTETGETQAVATQVDNNEQKENV